MNSLKKIATVHSPFKEKFGVPRQAGLTPSIVSTIVFEKEFSRIEAFKGLEDFSHIWVLFYFSENKKDESFRTSVRPPRLGGNKKIGVFATRSPFRPNPIGLSKVKLKSIKPLNGRVHIEVNALDLVDQTPVFDIRPFIENDNEELFSLGWTKDAPKKSLPVAFSDKASSMIDHSNITDLKNQIIEVLSLDPRPQFDKEIKQKTYSFKFYHYDIEWTFKGNSIIVRDLHLIS